MSNVRAFIYKQVPKKWRRRLGSSSWLKPIRDSFFRTSAGYREHTSYVSKQYLDYNVQFKFVSSIQIATKAAEKGMETTLLKNSISLLHKFKSREHNDYVIADVGANFGFLSLVWSTTVCSNGKVYSFEPHPNVRSSFLKSVHLNALKNIIVEPFAVGKTAGSVEISFANTTSNTIEEEAKKRSAQTKTSIEMVCLNDYFKDCKRLDMIKIDVDGIELAILEGAFKVIEELQPIVVVETNGNTKICDFFFNQNYQIFDMKLNEITESTNLPLNVFCVPK